MLELVLLYKNPLLQISLTLIIGFTFALFKVPLLFLYGLQTYIHPDSQPQSNGARAAIRRPGVDGYQPLSAKTAAELKKRNKSKDKSDFDENNAQIFRIRLNQDHLQSRLFIDQYCVAFTLSFAAILSLLLHNFLQPQNNRGFFANGVFLPFALSILRLLFVPEGVSLVLEFRFGVPFDGFWRVFVAALMGCLAGFLFIPASRSARCFWIGTDQIRCNLSMMTCGWFTRAILYANQAFVIFVALLWITPLAEVFVNKRDGVAKSAFGNAEKLVGNVGFLASDFDRFRQWCLLGSSLLQIVALRPNIQMYLNEALLSWYQRLHASKVPDLDYSRAKMFLHNHYLCLVVLQFLAPPVLVLLFLALSQVDGVSFGNRSFPLLSGLLPSFALFKEVALFLAWWVTFLWALFSSAILLLHRHCVLYVS
uniref:Transmembrane protein 161B family n=1 Tax=Cajanus cajan TaxID=3821 RepID=A0A151U6I3_CAJCA|nr:Transmembrane protein 161B family [Cajanus cajan]